MQKTLYKSKEAIFAVCTPHPNPKERERTKEFPYPNGTGFFISEDGFFLTARHVLIKETRTGEEVLQKLKDVWLEKPEGYLVKNTELIREWPQFDIALLKADFEECKERESFKDKTGFDYLEIEKEIMPEGTEVYSFGYPLTRSQVMGLKKMTVGLVYWSPRATSAIISSHHNIIGPVWSPTAFPTHYVIDKALNPGNSGGPIIVKDSGRVISICTAFQMFRLKQGGEELEIEVPSLYGITISLNNILEELSEFLPT